MIDAHTERMMKVIRKAEARDLAAVLELAALLWPGHSGEELAEEFGCSPDSIRMKLTRARRKALEMIKEGGFCFDPA